MDVLLLRVVLSCVSCSRPGSVLVVCCRVEVWHILFMLVLSLFNLLCSGMQFWISCTTEIGHYNVMKYGRFFAREYLYIG